MIFGKKASVPEVILVLGVLAIFGLLLFSFSIVNSKAKDCFNSVSRLEEIHFAIEKFYFYKNVLELSETDSSALLGIPLNTDANGRFLDFKIQNANALGGISQIKFYIDVR